MIKTLENDIYWQTHVLNNSKDKRQQDRCRLAIQRLQKQIDELKRVKLSLLIMVISLLVGFVKYGKLIHF